MELNCNSCKKSMLDRAEQDEKKIEKLEAENKRYREALQRISTMYQGMMFYDESQFSENIAKKAIEEGEK